MTTVTLSPGSTWTAPAGVVSVLVQAWAEGGNGGTGLAGGSSHSGGGGGGGEFAQDTVATTPGTLYSPTIGAGGTSTDTVFVGDNLTVTAHHGVNSSGSTAGSKGTGSANSVHFDGGQGGSGLVHSNPGGGGGGGGAGSGGGGGNGTAGALAGSASGGSAGSGSGGAGGNGGNGTITGNPGQAGASFGAGGGGGAGRTGGTSGGNGAPGQIILTYTAPSAGTAALTAEGILTAAGSIAGAATLTGGGTLTAARSGSGNAALSGGGTLTAGATIAPAAALSGGGTLTAAGGLPSPTVVNQWATTFAQSAAFGTTAPALQSVVVDLNPGNTEGPGSGVPTAGNWLFCISGWNQGTLPAATFGTADDIHSFWRPGDVTRSSWAVSTGTAKTRVSIWYTPNLARSATDVYAAPDGAMAGQACLVVEIAGLGPWDTVTGINTNYAAAATTLNLALSAPSQAAFTIAAVCGDATTAGQAFAPATWTTLAAISASNGTDHTCDAVLTSAFLPSTLGSVSVNGTASSATDLSGVALQVLVGAPSPIPGGANPSWPGRMILELASGSGYETPPDQMTWTTLSDNAWTSTSQGWKRSWSWADSTGVPYALGQLQSSTGTVQLDNWDGAMSPLSAAGATPWSFTAHGTPGGGTFFTVTTAQAASIAAGDPFTDTLNPGTLFKVTGLGAPSGGFVNVSFTPVAGAVMASPDVITRLSPTTGTPVRQRMALGTLTDGTVVNRWYTWSRNALAWPEKRNRALRGFVPLTTTDIWSVVAGSCPTPYRGEVEQDNPGWWWPMDDQPLSGGVQPSSLRNAAAGSSTVMSVIASPSGVSAGDQYTTTGFDATSDGLSNAGPPPSVAVASVGQQQGWLYGDPQSSPQSSSTGNPVTSNPGSAAWQQAGLLGAGGSNTWFLAANDTFPALSGGVTVKGWFNASFFGSATGYKSGGGDRYDLAAQPYSVITLATLSTASAPVAVLQLSLSGALNLITYAGTTPTSHTVYSGSDLRCGSWISVDLQLTQTTWKVLVNGGLTASASGTVSSMTSAWTWLTLNGDYGTAGGSSPGSVQHGGNVAYSHWIVFPGVLPAWRLTAHYSAAITGFGLLPAPQTVALSKTASEFADGSHVPDGSVFQGSYGNPGGSSGKYSFSAVTAAQAGPYTSGPSARAAIAGIGTDTGGVFYGDAVWVSWTSLCPSTLVYTSASAAAETNASTTLGSGESYTSGYGSGASGHGVSHVSGGTGTAPPAAAGSLGDTVAGRIERVLGYGGITAPNRAIDAAAELVQAALDVGGQSAGASLQAQVDSDNGLLFVDLNNTLCYKSRAHLSADQAAGAIWQVGMNVAGGQRPYDQSVTFGNDPQRIYDAIGLTPYSPDGASLPTLTPANATAVNAAQQQFGVRPKNLTSYLQSQASIQSAANWWFATFGTLVRRVEVIRLDAATHPAAWLLILALNCGDIIQVTDIPLGAPQTVASYRVSQIQRQVSYGANGQSVEASATIVADALPASYWGV